MSPVQSVAPATGKIPYLCGACHKATSRSILLRFAGVCAHCHRTHRYPRG